MKRRKIEMELDPTLMTTDNVRAVQDLIRRYPDILEDGSLGASRLTDDNHVRVTNMGGGLFEVSKTVRRDGRNRQVLAGRLRVVGRRPCKPLSQTP